MDKTQRAEEIIATTTFVTKCLTCGHTRDYHELGDIFYKLLFGIKLGACQHYEVKGKHLPVWKRRKAHCECKEFIPKREVENE